MRERKSSLHFTGRRHARNGIISTVIAGIAWCIFAALTVYASVTVGNADKVAGILGILDAIFALAGMIVAYKGFQERDVFYGLPIVGMILNGILFVAYFSLYLLGISLG